MPAPPAPAPRAAGTGPAPAPRGAGPAQPRAALRPARPAERIGAGPAAEEPRREGAAAGRVRSGYAPRVSQRPAAEAQQL
ncbi:translation initiation factor IF-2-like [Oenanthe melanoleuca]|uniref:translation initiation factor IF-2-like n=1 Tax=Oenanthe melanoleuca TaxID=2939378 RepID=UPI0024C10FD9|nr:translation initiation factor IF-2-like [Oenanthe melanoleuca]